LSDPLAEFTVLQISSSSQDLPEVRPDAAGQGTGTTEGLSTLTRSASEGSPSRGTALVPTTLARSASEGSLAGGAVASGGSLQAARSAGGSPSEDGAPRGWIPRLRFGLASLGSPVRDTGADASPRVARPAVKDRAEEDRYQHPRPPPGGRWRVEGAASSLVSACLPLVSFSDNHGADNSSLLVFPGPWPLF
jgi:hypothetical protein